jgi:O-antigen/teichoic acid export membrane protein
VASALHRLTGFVARLLGLPERDTTTSPLLAMFQLIGSDLAITAVGFAFTATLIRSIGPIEFGQANLIVSVSQLLLVALTFGLPTTAARFLADRQSPATVATLSAAQLATLAAAVPLLWIARTALADRLEVSPELYLWALGYGVLLTWQLLVEGVLSGLREFARLARLNLIAGLVFIAATAAALATASSLDFRDYLWLNAVRWIVLVALGAWWLRSRLGRVVWAQTLDCFRYGAYQTASALTHFFVLGSIDSLMLNAYHGPAAVGLYGAYYAAFNVVISRFVKVMSGVFLPAATVHEARDRVLRRVTAAYLRLAWLIVPAVVALSFVLFRFYGSAYPFSAALAALMGVCVMLHVGVSILMDLATAAGLAGVRRNLVAAAVTAIANVAFNLLFIPRWGVAGTILATALAFTLGLLYRYVSLTRLLRGTTGAH